MLDGVQEANQSTPLLFILSPGVDPFKDVEDLARRNGFTLDNGSFLNVALGDGQEEFATRALKEAHAKGGWVMLQSIPILCMDIIYLCVDSLRYPPHTQMAATFREDA